jgi:hypothetical protein
MISDRQESALSFRAEIFLPETEVIVYDGKKRDA